MRERIVNQPKLVCFSRSTLALIMATEPARPFTDEQLHSDDTTKKDIIKFLHEEASFEFLKQHKLNGKLNNVAKTSKKDALILAYQQLYEQKAFKSEEEKAAGESMEELTKKAAEMKVKAEGDKDDAKKKKKKKGKEEEAPKFTKKILKAGDGSTFPQKGDRVTCFYIGKLLDGTIFDTNISQKSKKVDDKPLIFKVGTGQVIRGWDEGLLTMSRGEKAELTIEPEWAYGRKGKPDAKIPPNSTLVFEVDLIDCN